MKYLVAIIVLFSLFSCIDNKDSKLKETTKGEVVEIFPLLSGIDSLQILYYNNPGADSIRYTRFYVYISLSDTSIINSLKSNLYKKPVASAEIKKCRSDGKIYCYGKGEIIKTIYFSTKCDTCCYLYLISNGQFFYYSLDNTFKDLLLIQKRNAAAPLPAQ